MSTWLTACEASQCIEVSTDDNPPYVSLRTTADPDTVLHATRAEWDELVAAIRAGKDLIGGEA